MLKLFTLLAILVAISVSSENLSSNNGTTPVIFRTSLGPSTSSDNENSGTRVTEQISADPVVFGPTNASPKETVSSHGYQLERIDDSTSEEGQGRSSSIQNAQKAEDRQISVYPSGSPEDSPQLIHQYLHPAEYDDNSAKEELNNQYLSKGKLSYDDVHPTSDITKVRDIFVDKRVNQDKSQSHPQGSEAYPSSPPLEHSNYKHAFENPIKYINSPILLKEGNLPLGHPIPLPLPRPQLHHHEHEHDDISGHTAGYGHGFHHHQQKLKSKPLKPSVVYRDPHDSFDHHDKIRTLDKDHLGKGHEPHHEKVHDYDSYHGKVIFKPEYYDQDKVPECAHKNKYIYNLTFCLDDPHYPKDTIIWALKEEGPHAKKLLTDVTYQSADNLVTGLTRAEEEGYTYKHYFGASHAQNVHLDKYKPPYQGYTYSTDYFKKGGYICPSDIFYARPKRAMNTFGKWKVIVNVDHIPEHEHGYQKHGHLQHYGKSVDIGHGIYGKDHYYPHHEHDKHHPHHEGPHHHEGPDKHHGLHEGPHHPHHEHDKHHPHHEGPHHHHEGPDKHHGLHEGPHHLHHEGPDKHHSLHQGPHHPHHEGLDKHHSLHEGPHHHLAEPHHNSLNNHLEGHGYGDSYPHHHSIKKREHKEKKYTQTLRLEQCIYSNAPCSYVDSHYHSKCIQKHNFVRLVAWTHDEGIHVDTFKLPIACSCHVQQPIHFYRESGHHEHKHGHVVPPVNYHQEHHDIRH